MTKILSPREMVAHTLEYQRSLSYQFRPWTPRLDIGIGPVIRTNFEADVIMLPLTMMGGVSVGNFLGLRERYPLNVKAIENAIFYTVTKTKYTGPEPVIVGRYVFDFRELHTLALQQLLKVIPEARGARTNYTWLAPLQELYFKKLDAAFDRAKKTKKPQVQRTAGRISGQTIARAPRPTPGDYGDYLPAEEAFPTASGLAAAIEGLGTTIASSNATASNTSNPRYWISWHPESSTR